MNKTALVTGASSGIGDMDKPSTKGTALITGASRASELDGSGRLTQTFVVAGRLEK